MPTLDELDDIVKDMRLYASQKRDGEIEKAKAYYAGYIDGCYDFATRMHNLIIQKASEEKQQ